MGADQTHGIIVVGNVIVNLVEGTHAQERAKGLHIGQKSLLGQACRDGDHVHLLDTHVQHPVGVFLLHFLHSAAAAGTVGVDVADSGIVFDHFKNFVGDSALGLHGRAHVAAAKCKPTH